MLPLLCALPAALRAQVSFGEATRFDDGWLFRLGDDTTARRPAYDDASRSEERRVGKECGS